MVNPIDDIFTQARSGSVAAIIQVLNDKLASSGVRTRAVLEKGVLQLLCEAHEAEQLDKSFLVDRVREILESLEPANIRRVRINSRIVREQQLLWLDEVSRDPVNQLLWFYDITLKKPSLFKRLFQRPIIVEKRAGFGLPKQMGGSSSFFEREQRQFWRGILIGGLGFSALLLLLAFVLHSSFGLRLSEQKEGEKPLNVAGNSKPVPVKLQSRDMFAEAVRLAEQTSALGKQAQSRDEWLVIAAKWEQASALMAAVPASHPRYDVAQNRAALYKQNGETAQDEAEKRQ
ncbi:hypothetical protein NG798_04760 [Ancylothrix sp. C2]|uniref:hypothetical protein n=1 Tax=Ancylothrix sp. D3o TaxID=2953691 RepID=UPI0021BB82EC|nr:hypothetical protein [Ancylothrix sp. D3o]MCT7949089.1 hypothetical protein [Ancylothrix sp. D3o]